MILLFLMVASMELSERTAWAWEEGAGVETLP